MELAILGPIEARLDGEVLAIPAGRQRALLALLALHAPKPVNAEAIGEALWPDATPSMAARSLQVTVSRLRRSLGAAADAVETVAAGYRLAVDPEAIDARRFERAVARCSDTPSRTHRVLDDALAWWRGPALADVAFESFAQGEIARLEELRLVALEQRAEARLAQGEHALLVPELEQLAAEHPSRERLLSLLMTALYGAGRQADALAVYDRGRRRLDEELGLQPSTELQRLQGMILRQDPALDAVAADGLGLDGVAAMLFAELADAPAAARAAGEAWPELLSRFRDRVVGAVGDAGGHVVPSAEEVVRAYFRDPAAAAAAATAVQRALPDEVRMGLHAGLVQRTAEGYGGIEVHLAERVAAAGHGGQIVVSDAARALLSGDDELVDLGEHRLPGHPDPERLWLLLHDGRRPEDHPPLRTEPVRPTNLPADPRPLVGRAKDIETVAALLAGEDRLVTVLGLGGTGKTRLAAAVGERLLTAFEGGVWLVALADVRDPDELVPAIATAMDVAEREEDVQEALLRRLRVRPTLLVLDNLEQLVDAACRIDELLEGSPSTRVLATSQLPLRLVRERLYRLPPLDDGSAVLLFEQRAGAAAPGLELRRHHAAVEAICAFLDGMPLAVELAAARIATLAPDELLARLTHSTGILARGPRDLAERHRSLRATLEWTHALLGEEERVLLARLAAFAGPAPLSAVEAVAAVTGVSAAVDAVDALAGLLDASFVQREETREHRLRYTLAQAVRDFAAEQLRASGEEHAVRRAHGAHLAASGEAIRGAGDADAVRGRMLALEAEQRPALAWALAEAPDLHTRLALALALSMVEAGRSREAYTALRAALPRTEGSPVQWGRAALLTTYAAMTIGRAGEDGPLVEQGLAALREGGDDAELWFGLRLAYLFVALTGDMEAAFAIGSEMIENARARGHTGDLAASLLGTAHSLVHLGRLGEAEARLAEAAPLLPAVGDRSIDPSDIHADIAAERGAWARAAALYARGARSQVDLRTDFAWTLRRAAVALANAGRDDAAVELGAVADELSATIDDDLEDFWVVRHGAALTAARTRLGEQRVTAAVRRARGLSAVASAERAITLTQAPTR